MSFNEEHANALISCTQDFAYDVMVTATNSILITPMLGITVYSEPYQNERKIKKKHNCLSYPIRNNLRKWGVYRFIADFMLIYMQLSKH